MDVPANYLLLIENLLDITHFYPLHAGNIGDLENSRIPIEYEEGEIDLVTASMGRAKLLEAEARELQNRQIYLDARLDIEALVGPTKSEDVKE